MLRKTELSIKNLKRFMFLAAVTKMVSYIVDLYMSYMYLKGCIFRHSFFFSKRIGVQMCVEAGG